MSYQQKPGQGSLFKNDKKTSQNAPEYKGTININGQEFWLSAWIKEGTKGKFFSLSAQAKDPYPETRQNTTKPPQRKQEPAPAWDLDDSIPF